MSHAFRVAPPSARSARTGSPIAETTSAVWKAIASSAARAISARPVPRVMPEMSPRASASQYGEPSPVSAGTKWTPPVDSTERASASVSARVCDHPEPVAQPLDGRAGDEDRALEGGDAGLGSGGAEDAVRRRAAVLALVCEHEAAGAVGGLGVARPEAGLAEERGLLVARQAGERHPRAADLGLADDAARRHDPGQHLGGHAEERGQLGIPLDRVEPGEHRPRRVGRVGDMRLAAGQVPGEPALDRAEEDVALDAGEQPFELGRREVRVGHEPRALADEVGRELAAALRGAPVLPDDRRVERAPVAAPRRPSSRAGS